MASARSSVAALVLAGAALAASGFVVPAAQAAGTASAAARADEPVKVVYHLNEGIQQASRAIGNIRNHLKAAPDTKIVVVTHGAGIEFLLEGSVDGKGRPFSGPVGELAGRGVQFRVCANTLAARDIPKEQVAMEATVVDSGVAEVARLQAKEGYVYLRP